MRETVAAVADLLDGKGKDETVSVTHVAKALDLEKGPTSRRVKAATERGYLVNHEDKQGRPAKIAIGATLPEDTPVPPECCAVAQLMAGDNHPPLPVSEEHVAEAESSVQSPMAAASSSIAVDEDVDESVIPNANDDEHTKAVPDGCGRPSLCHELGPCEMFKDEGECCYERREKALASRVPGARGPG
jgi:hypothetical protein